MATTYQSMTERKRDVFEAESAESFVEAAGGVAVIILAIIGLVRSDTGLMTSITSIVLGATLLLQGGAIAAEFSKLFTVVSGAASDAVELSGGLLTEVVGGGTVLVLGILSLLGVHPMTLLPTAVIVTGTALIIETSAQQRLNELRLQASNSSDMAQKVAHAAASSASGAQVIAGITAIILGILALSSAGPRPELTLVAYLVLGAAVALSGTALTGRIMRVFAHRSVESSQQES